MLEDPKPHPHGIADYWDKDPASSEGDPSRQVTQTLRKGARLLVISKKSSRARRDLRATLRRSIMSLCTIWLATRHLRILLH
jgi:hypothetical protein